MEGESNLFQEAVDGGRFDDVAGQLAQLVGELLQLLERQPALGLALEPRPRPHLGADQLLRHLRRQRYPQSPSLLKIDVLSFHLLRVALEFVDTVGSNQNLFNQTETSLKCLRNSERVGNLVVLLPHIRPN